MQMKKSLVGINKLGLTWHECNTRVGKKTGFIFKAEPPDLSFMKDCW